MVIKKCWKYTYQEYNKLLHCDQKEIDASFNQSSSRLMLRLWEEFSTLFLDFLT